MDVLDRIRKLHRLAEGTNYPAEAEVARRKAAELQEAHGLLNARSRFQAPGVPADWPPKAIFSVTITENGELPAFEQWSQTA